MKVYQGILFLLAISNLVNAQNKTFSVGTVAPNTNAALHVESPTNNQGLIMPRLTTAQRTAMVLTASDIGLQLYDTDLKGIFSWDGTGWRNGGIVFPLSGSANTASNAFSVSNTGTGRAGFFAINNASNTLTALLATSNGSGTGIVSTATGTGGAGFFSINNASNNLSALFASTNGTGSAAGFEITNASSSANGMSSITNSSGAAIFAEVTNGGYAALDAKSSGSNGNAGLFHIANASNSSSVIAANTIGSGSVGYFTINNSSSTAPAIYGSTNGPGYAAYFTQSGSGPEGTLYSENTASTGSAGIFKITNPASADVSCYATTAGSGQAIYAEHTSGSAAGQAASFRNYSSNILSAAASFTSSTGPGYVVGISHSGTGPLIVGTQYGSGDQAIFQKNGIGNVARIGNDGKGFFNGGTQSSGADVAEMFDVEGVREGYEPGDVLVISESTDRTVEKSSLANSTKVVGVYATKPGVILTEKGIEENLDNLVPLGVVGVIPTKVCLENGPIKRGDLLVTSSRKGHAMKAVSSHGDGMFPAGTIIGKALENFEGNESGIIRVLVNVK